MLDGKSVTGVLTDLLALPFPAENPSHANRNSVKVRGFRGQGYPQELRVYLAASQDFYDDSIPDDSDRITEAERTVEAFRADFRQLCAEIVAAWGVPAYQEVSLESQGFRYDFVHECDGCPPEPLEQQLWQRGAFSLAYWERDCRIAYLAAEHQDSELPVFLVAGCIDKS